MVKQHVLEKLSDLYSEVVFTRRQLLDAGWTGAKITRAVASGALVRVRRDRYTHASTDAQVVEAVRIGGRISCLSLLSWLGVFVLDVCALHVQLAPHASRIRPPLDSSTVMHWVPATCDSAREHVAALSDAVSQAVRCQHPRAALATLDSVVHLGLMSVREVTELVRALPRRFHALIPLVDGSAESGPETFMRLILRTLGVAFRTQVQIPGVGRVDFVVDGWLIIECDSRAHHEGWQKQKQDRERDIAAARHGYVTIRPLANDVLRNHDEVRLQIADILRAFSQMTLR